MSSRTGRESKKIKKESIKRARSILVYLKPYKGWFTVGMIILFLSSITTLLVPRLLGQFAGIGLSEEEATSILDIGSLSLDMMSFKTVGILLGIVFLIQALLSFFKVFLFSYVSEHMMRDLRTDLFAHMVRLPMSYFVDQRVGDLNSRISADIATVQETLTTTLAEFVRQIITIVLGLSVLFYLSLKLALVMLATLPAMIIVAVFFGRYVRKLSKQTQNLVAESNVVVQEALMGIVNVKSFTNERFETSQYRERADAVKVLAIKTSIWRGLFAAFIIIFLFGSIALVMGVGSMLIKEGLEPGEFLGFLFYTVMIGASGGGIATQYSAIQKALGAVESVLDILEKKIEPIPLTNAQDLAKPLELTGNLSFNQVNFSYPSRPDIQVLRDVSFSIKAGEQIAIVGPSGAGKSTIAALVLGFYHPQQGDIRFDDKPGQSFSLSDLRDQMAYVPQEILLFGGSIRDNISYGRTDATDDEITRAAKQAQAWEFIEIFEDGLDTMVGDRGIQLSGGQKQRIAIARALLKDPAILILDEATSSLDSASESLVQQALETLMKGRTSLVIAHRLSTIRGADKILVVSGGDIVETGTHAELIAYEDGVYAGLSKLQVQDSPQDLA
jgi:ABC-type multidrug transport system fused ATPase/permease subunit